MATLRADSQAAADKQAADQAAYQAAMNVKSGGQDLTWTAGTPTAPAGSPVYTAPTGPATSDTPKTPVNVPIVPPKTPVVTVTPPALTVASTMVDPITGNQYNIMSDGSRVLVASDTFHAQRQNAFDLLASQFKTFGLIKEGDSSGTALLNKLHDLILSGAGSDTVSLALQQDPVYQARFAGNAIRLKNGLSVLSPAEYIATETAYDQVLKGAGIDTSIYFGKDKQTALLGGDVSATELQNRVSIAAKSIANADPFYAQTLQNYYGLTSGQMIAHVLDPAAAVPLLQKQAQSAGIGSAAAQQGLGISSGTAENLYGQNISEAQAQQGFKNVALNISPEQGIAARFGGDAGAQGQNLVASTFGLAGAAYAEQQMRALNTRETNEFSGSAGAAKGSLYSDSTGVL